MKAALYVRCSTRDQHPEAQLAPLLAYAERRGWEVQQFIDHAVSGRRSRRPGLDALLEAVRSRKVDAIAITKLDRLFRSTRHLSALAAELEALGVDLVATSSTATPSVGRAASPVASRAPFAALGGAP